MAEQVIEIVRLYVGRGLRADPFLNADDDDKLELSVDLLDMGAEMDEALLPFQAHRSQVWLPLTTVVGGVPELVWEADNTLIPTSVPVED